MIELLVVMGIMAVLAGITAASYVGITQRASREGARDNVMGVLRQARVAAVDSGRGAVVRIEPSTASAPATVYGISSDVIGAWHFEENNGGVTPGAQRYDGTVTQPDLANDGPVSIVAGKMGLGFHFPGDVNANQQGDYVDCGNAPIWNQTSGIRVEAWVRPEAPASGTSDPIMSKENVASGLRGYFLGADYNAADGTVTFEGGFAVVNNDGSPSGGGPMPGSGAVFVSSPATQAYAVGQWHHVAAEFDGFEARLFVDGVLVGSDGAANAGAGDSYWTTPGRIVPARGDALLIGAGLDQAMNPAFFTGTIDEPRVISIASGTPVTLPDRVALLTSTEAVHYTAQGFLDPAYHNGDVYVALGDPYQTAPLSGTNPTTIPGGTDIYLARQSPFPPSGGEVMLGGYVVHYTGTATTSINGDTLTGLTWNYATPTATTTYYGAGAPAGQVYFCRLIDVTRTGLVTKP